MALYNIERHSNTPDTGIEAPDSEQEMSDEEDEEEEEEEEMEGEKEQGMELLVAPDKTMATEEGFSGVAAAAEQFQPKGITLATTEVRCMCKLHTIISFYYWSR